MERISQLNSIVEQHDLNRHPFYKDWVAGTLPIEKLRAYAAEYGHFIATIAEGWDAVGRPDIAEEERYHERLWSDFRGAINASGALENAETAELVLDARNAFKSRASAIGALYAFEAQQPYTSASKLSGLNKHYDVSEAGKRYFEIHADDTAEPEMLSKMAEELSDEEFIAAKANCQRICKSMWAALDGVYATRPLATV